MSTPVNSEVHSLSDAATDKKHPIGLPAMTIKRFSVACIISSHIIINASSSVLITLWWYNPKHDKNGHQWQKIAFGLYDIKR